MEKIVCIGGLIACGKTHFTSRLSQYCVENGVQCKILNEVYSPSLYNKIKSNLSVVDAFVLSHRIQMAIDAPEIAKNYDILFMERSVIDHIAFFEAFERCGMVSTEWVSWGKKVIEEINPPYPDQFIFLDIDPAEALLRKERRGYEYDKAFHLDFMCCLRDAYLQLIYKHYPEPVILDWSHFGEHVELDKLINERLLRTYSKSSIEF
jgi:deoxyadenosine/deoxycytidine kinase